MGSPAGEVTLGLLDDHPSLQRHLQLRGTGLRLLRRAARGSLTHRLHKPGTVGSSSKVVNTASADNQPAAFPGTGPTRPGRPGATGK